MHEPTIPTEFIEPTTVEITIDGDTEFPRRFGARVRALLGRYTDVRASHNRYVTLPITQPARDLAREILRTFPVAPSPYAEKRRELGKKPFPNLRLNPNDYALEPRPAWPVVLAFRWERHVSIPGDGKVAVPAHVEDPIGEGLTLLRKEWNVALAAGMLVVYESESERAERLAEEKRQRDYHGNVLRHTAVALGAVVTDVQGAWGGDEHAVEIGPYRLRFAPRTNGLVCTAIALRDTPNEPMPTEAVVELLYRLSGK